MGRSRQLRFAYRTTWFFLSVALACFVSPLGAQAPDPNAAPKADVPPASPLAQSPPEQSPPEQSPPPIAAGGAANSSEVASHDTPPTFKVRVNLVQVRVVVRDSQGNVVPNLKRDDFQLLDNRKQQSISTFNVETPESHAIVATSTASGEPAAPGAAPAGVTALPQRFVAVVFDDTDMLSDDALSVRDAATRLFDVLAPSDRVGMYTTSGQLTQEFTADHALLKSALLSVVPRPLASTAGLHDCPDISYYQADQIVNFREPQALSIATEDTIQCAFNGNEAQQVPAAAVAQAEAQQVASRGDAQTEYVYRHLEDTMRRLSSMPGQRIMVLVSPGFIVTQNTREAGDLIDRANKANIVINTIDARGLYTSDLLGDISDPQKDSLRTRGYKSSYRIAAQFAQSDILSQLADGTGGTLFHNRNDIDQGLRRAAGAPALSYILGFSPQNLKVDGRYHTLKVTLTSKQKYVIQARHGYYAPRSIKDPAEAAKQEIQEAIFSQEEMRDVPIDLQTQFFKTEQMKARLAVLTRVDLKGIHFRKTEGRSRDDLTFATAIFDENGNFVTGGEKIVEMRLLDPTLDRLNHSGFTVKSSFDIKPGTYLVRMVVRDTEGSQMAARNGAVVIPY